jgi:hypothetical protein
MRINKIREPIERTKWYSLQHYTGYQMKDRSTAVIRQHEDYVKSNCCEVIRHESK